MTKPTLEKGQKTTKLTSEELRKLMTSPKYWKEHDWEITQRINQGFKKLYNKES